MVFDTPDTLYRLLDLRGNALVRDLLASHNGLFRFGDRDPLDARNTFKIAYLRAGQQHRLTVTRQSALGTTRAQRFQLAMEDLFRRRGARAIERRLSDGKANAGRIAEDLKADFGEISTRLWPPGSLEDAVAAQGLQFSAEDVTPWLTDDTAGVPFSLRSMDKIQTGIVGGDTLALVCRHENALVEIRFRSDGSSRGARSIDRMRRMAKGSDGGAGHFGEYSNLRALMAKFMCVSVEEEAPALLYERACSRVPRVVPDKQALETRTRDYVCLPIAMEPAPGAHEVDAAIARAVRASMADYRLHARNMANTMAIAPAADAALSLHTLDAYTWAGLHAIQTAAEERLRGHPLAAFCSTVEQQIGVSPQAWEDFTTRVRGVARGVTAAGMPDVDGGPPLIAAIHAPAGTEVVRFEGKPSFWQALRALWGRLQGPLRGPDANRPAREAVLVATWPAALRFPVGTNATQGRCGIVRLGAAQAYLGLPRLYEKLHRSLYDNAMHEDVLPAVRTAVAKVVGAMRKEMRAAWVERSQFKALVSRVASHFGIPDENALSAMVAMREYFSAEREAAFGQRSQAAGDNLPGNIRRADTRLERGAALATEAFDAAQAAVNAAEQAQGDALRTLHWQLRQCNSVQAERVPVLAAFRDALADARVSLSGLLEHVPGMEAFRHDVLMHEERIDQHERLLRQRLDAVRVGKATLGEFETWAKAEIAYAEQPAGALDAGGDQAFPSAVAQADAREGGRRGPQSPAEAVYWHLIERLSGIVDASTDRVEAGDAIAAYGSDGRLRRLPAVATVVASSHVGRRSTVT